MLDGQADIYAQRVAWAPSLAFPDSIDFGIMKVGQTVSFGEHGEQHAVTAQGNFLVMPQVMIDPFAPIVGKTGHQQAFF